jgi:cell division protein FtsW
MTAAAKQNDAYYYLKRQGLFFASGAAVMLLTMNISYRYFRSMAFMIYLAANALLVVAAFIGISSHGAQRWIPVPIIGQFQPSEVAKAGVIFYMAFLIAQNPKMLLKWPTFILACGVVGVTAGLVMLGNSLSMAIIVTLVGMGIIFIACPYIMRFVVVIAGGVAGLAGYFMYTAMSAAENFRIGRIEAWINPFSDPTGDGFQVIQSLYAIASGGMFGLGIGNSRQKTFVPEAHNDIIFSIICEELGFVGGALVLALFGILIWRGLKIAMNAPDTFSSLTAAGIMILISAQVVLNVAVVTNSMPNTGVPLPFISYGGTSLMVTLFLVGVLLNISRHSKKS